jgi:hypothetical protein
MRISNVSRVSLSYEPSILHGLDVLVVDSFGAARSEILCGCCTHHHSSDSLPVLSTALFLTYLISFRA